jgi:ABC-2 type transport system permease protein
MIFKLLKGECRQWWTGSLLYVTGAGLLSGAAYFFFTYLHTFQQQVEQYRAGFLGNVDPPSLRLLVIEPYFETVGFLLVFVVPLLSLRLFAEERKTGLLPFLFTTPVRLESLLLSKYFGALISFSGVLLLCTVPVFWLGGSSSLPLVASLSGFLALVLLSALYLALGVALSQVVFSPLPLAVTHFLSLITLYFLPALSSTAFGGFGGSIRAFSPVPYSTHLIEGFFSVEQVVFFLGMITAALLFALFQLRVERYQAGGISS